ncbi:hypothetical protein AVEN_56847-1 [Araneus ventricosus]|uniref:Retrovirus-related Pol polyprotein from transposon TNT 1-94-like beta-barrel domain-containing protein n=1 Tax=Araneus ventricosus TaxID=182803 RepID=A0A4Y2S331_ARAVE|nr:hypothetical protein AVEN_56847-1 [Araneus ventricosus]
MLANLPRGYDNIVMHLYQLDDKNFTSLNVQKSLLAEYDRVIVREKFEARPKEPAVFPLKVMFPERRILQTSSKKGGSVFFVELLVILERTAGNSMPIRCLLINNVPTFKQDGLSNPAVLYAYAYCTQSMDMEFVIDSAATEHFVNDINLFTNFQKLSSSASMTEGTTNILGKGDVNLEIMDNSDFELSSNETPMPKLSDKTECDWKRACVTIQK